MTDFALAVCAEAPVAFKHGNEDQRQEAIDDLMDVFWRYGRFGGRG